MSRMVYADVILMLARTVWIFDMGLESEMGSEIRLARNVVYFGRNGMWIVFLCWQGRYGFSIWGLGSEMGSEIRLDRNVVYFGEKAFSG